MPKKLELTPEQEAVIKHVIKDAEKKAQKHAGELADRFQKRFHSISMIHSDCQKNRAEHPNLWPIMEMMGRAAMPKEALYKRCFTAMAKLRKDIRANKWKTLQKTIADAEKAINAYDIAVTRYVNSVVSGSNRSVSALKFTKTAGMVALGVLCVTFAAPYVTGALAEAGMITALTEGTLSTAAIHGSLGAFFAVNLKGFASAVGKTSVGDFKRIDVKGHLKDTAYSTGMGIFAGWAGGASNGRLAQLFGKNAAAVNTQMRTRVTVGTLKAALEDIYATLTKRAPAITKAAVKKMTGKETEAEFEALLFMEMLQDRVFVKALAEALEKQREMGPFPK